MLWCMYGSRLGGWFTGSVPCSMKEPRPSRSGEEVCPVCGRTAAEATGGHCPLFPAWSNEMKVQYLFEQIKPQDGVGAELYSFWSSAIEHFCKTRQRASFTHDEIMLAYKRRGVVTAMGIGRVLAEMRKRGDVMPVISKETSPSFPLARWAVRTLIMDPISLIWSYVTDKDEDDARGAVLHEEQGRQAYVPLLKELSGVLVAHFQSRLEVERTVSLIPWDRGLTTQVPVAENPEQQPPGTITHGVCTFQGACQAAASTSARGMTAAMLARLQEEDAMSLVEYMVATGQAVRQGDVLKVTPVQPNTKPTITDADRKVLDFRIRVNKLEGILRERERQGHEAKSAAMSLHKKGLTSQARVQLARYKQLEGSVEKLRGAVLNLLTLHYTIEGVSSDLEIFTGLKSGSEALKQARASSGLTVRKVDDAMLEAEELIHEQRVVTEALSQPLDSGVLDSDADLYKELDALALEEEAKSPVNTAAGGVAVTDLPDILHLKDLSGLLEQPQTAKAEVKEGLFG